MSRGLVALMLIAGGAAVLIDWNDTVTVTRTTPTCQVVVEPSLWPTSKVRETQLYWLSQLGEEATPVFWQSWFLYPHSGVAELHPGAWDFSQITPLLLDMLKATAGRELVLQFGTVPAWLQSGPGHRGADFGSERWNATQTWEYKGNVSTPHAFRNVSQVASYFASFMSYYTKGGFTDPATGKRYDSGLELDIPWFEYGNEMEYKQTPRAFTEQSDTVTAAVAAVAPNTKFLGLGLSQGNYGTPTTNFTYFEYFLDEKNHAPGAPMPEAIDYHYYATPSSRTNVSTYQELFGQGDAFIQLVEGAEAVRKRLSPTTKTFLKELGVILHGDPSSTEPIPDLFWSASAAYWAYLYLKLALLQIDVAGMSQLVGGPNSPSTGHGDNYPSVTMLDWVTGKPTARWYVLKMLVKSFGSRLKRMVKTNVSKTPFASEDALYVQAVEVSERNGSKSRKLVVVNKRMEQASLAVGSGWGCMESIDGRDPWGAPALTPAPNPEISLASFGVAILTDQRCDTRN